MKSFTHWVLCSLSSYYHVWKLYSAREFESEYEDMYYKDKSESLKDEDKIVEDSDQN